MQAMILAAGMGKRLKELTKNNTKCMVQVNGVTLIDRMLHQIEKKNLNRIIIVAGYKGKELKEYISTLDICTPILYVDNPIFNKTNNIYSLALAKDYLVQDDTLLFESDIIFEDAVLDALMDDPRDTLALVDKFQSWMDGTCVKLSADDSIEMFIPGKAFRFEEATDYYKTVNIYKFSKHFSQTLYVPFLEAYQRALGENEYYEQVLRVITMLDDPRIRAKRLEGQRWYEIDDSQDLDIAAMMFMDDSAQKAVLLQKQFGGYWRYPKLIDFCLLVNPYYPNEKMVAEIKANFEPLLTQYPSGMRMNASLAAKNFAVKQEYITVGNGAAELIKSLMRFLGEKDARIGLIRPTFEEYPNRYDKDKEIVFDVSSKNFTYSASDVIQFFDDKPINALILINPDNPSGNLIDADGLRFLTEWAKQKKLYLVIDESFADFSNEKDLSLLKNSILETYEGLTVIKSISKSYGVPGLRLGVLASGNQELLSFIKKDVSIWNINSYAEFFMQIFEKYKGAYENGLDQIRHERARFIEELKKIPEITVFPSEANYVMVRLHTITARELTNRLLKEDNLLIKDLSDKVGENYIRLAVRKREDNDRLLVALRRMVS